MKRLLLGIIGALVLGGLSAVGATHADSPLMVTPTVDCVTLSSSTGLLTVQWGYSSTNSTTLFILIGPDNHFNPFPSDQGQPLQFQSGTFTDVFATTFDPNASPSQTWSLGGDSATASLSSPRCVGSNPPIVSLAPTVIGTPIVGETLTADDGEWLTDCTVSFANTWQSPLNGGPWTSVGTGTTYAPIAADLGALLRVEVVASNCHGAASAVDSAAVGPVAPAPATIGAPLLPIVDCVTFNSSANTLTVQWGYFSALSQTQNVPVGAQNAVSPAPTSGAQVTAFDAGAHHNAWIATISPGQTAQLTWTLDGQAATASVASPECDESSPPTLTTPPTVIGTPVVGQTLTAADGVWLANCALSFGATWQRSINGGAWASVGTNNTYTPVAADVAALLRVEVVASDCHGAASAADSAPVGPVAQPPVNTSPPTIKSAADDQRGRSDSALNANPGAWSGSPAPSFSYQWQRCTETRCTDIAGANKAVYTPRDADSGAALRVVVTAQNAAGSATAVSAETAPIDGRGNARGG